MKTKLVTFLAVMAAAVSAIATPTAKYSTRANIGTGLNVGIVGFDWFYAQRLVVRGLGPSIASSLPSGTRILSNPTLGLYDANGNLLIQQHSWLENSPSSQALITNLGLAPSSSNECVILLENGLFGVYTAILSGENGSTGIGYVDVYFE